MSDATRRVAMMCGVLAAYCVPLSAQNRPDVGSRRSTERNSVGAADQTTSTGAQRLTPDGLQRPIVFVNNKHKCTRASDQCFGFNLEAAEIEPIVIYDGEALARSVTELVQVELHVFLEEDDPRRETPSCDPNTFHWVDVVQARTPTTAAAKDALRNLHGTLVTQAPKPACYRLVWCPGSRTSLRGAFAPLGKSSKVEFQPYNQSGIVEMQPCR